MVTIKDIAKIAGVSVATVSMVINNKEGISQKTRDKVLKIVKEMQYVPRASARTLKTGKTRILGIVVGQLSNFYSSDIIAAVEEVARQYGYDLFICNAELNPKNTLKSLRALSAREVDGILLSVAMHPEQLYVDQLHELMKKGTQIVSLSRNLEGYGIPTVGFKDDAQVSQLITKLIALGHQNIGMLAAPEGSWMNHHRTRVFEMVVKEYNLYNEDYIMYSDIDIYKSKEDTIKLLERHPEITAIYAINDMMAIGALEAAKELGIKVPQELSIMGSDGIPYVKFTSPEITTIMTPRYEVGKRGAKKIIDMIEKRDTDYEEFIEIPCSYIQGGSVASPRRRERANEKKPIK